MQIVAGAQQCLTTYDSPHRSKEISFSVGEPFDRHRPVHVKVDALEWSVAIEPLQNLIGHLPVGCVRHNTPRKRAGDQQRHTRNVGIRREKRVAPADRSPATA
jgi:hypothetical protein